MYFSILWYKRLDGVIFIKIDITNEIRISGVNAVQIDSIKEQLTISNPLFSQRIELNLPNWGVPSQLKYYRYDKIAPDQIIIPVGALPAILEKDIISPKKEDIVDNRFEGKLEEYFSNIEFKATLRSYQEEAVNACKSKTVGVLEALTSSGKTLIFIKLILDLKKSALILVNTIELANQTKKAILKVTNLKENDIGLIGSGKFDIKPITVGLHQTMSSLDGDKYSIINNTFGVIIADEVHIVAAKTYATTMNKLSAKHKYGFSGTVRREDGLTPVIHFVTGPKIHTISKEELVDYVIKPDIKYINTDYYYPLLSTQEYQDMITDLSSDSERNDFIVEELNKNYKDNYVILLCNRIEQVKQLSTRIGADAVILTSKMKKKERVQVIKDLESKNKKYVVSTYALFSTGIDIPHLDTLFLCAPIRSEIKLRQSAGRLMRKAANKTTATVVDFIDIKVELLKYHSYKRKKIFAKL